MDEPPINVTILGKDWPGRPLPLMPGDLNRTLPQGLGLAVPLIATPWVIGPSPGYYGLDTAARDPFRAAPTQDPYGGVLYFDERVEPEKLSAALEVIGVHTSRKDYALFAAHAEDPVADRYLDQMRIASKAALGHFFEARAEAAGLPDQPLALGAFIEIFIAEQRSTWNSRSVFSDPLAGTLGGDGEWAKESLAFGFLVENTSWGVYRVWSRPWLVTK
jgi:hypothetical protein